MPYLACKDRGRWLLVGAKEPSRASPSVDDGSDPSAAIVVAVLGVAQGSVAIAVRGMSPDVDARQHGAGDAGTRSGQVLERSPGRVAHRRAPPHHEHHQVGLGRQEKRFRDAEHGGGGQS